MCSVNRYARYRFGCRTELTEVSGTGIDAVPNLQNCPVPVFMLYQLTEVSGTSINVVPVLWYRHRYILPYRYRRWYMYRAYPVFHSGTRLRFNILLTLNSNQKKTKNIRVYALSSSQDRHRHRYRLPYRYRRYISPGVSNVPKFPVPVLMLSRSYQSVRYRY